MHRPSPLRIFSLAVALVAACLCSLSAHADEVIIVEGVSQKNVSLGDYSCSPCFSKLASAYEFKSDADPSTIEMTAGELWQFFDSQGHQSVSTLTLFVDVDQLGLTESLNLSKLNVQIQNPNGTLATDTKLGSNRLVVPGIETSGNRPEAELRFDLGYDFMEMFSPESTEIVRVSIDAPVSQALQPRFHLTGSRDVFGKTNLSTMFLFVIFWGAVFLALLRFMKPIRSTAIPVATQRHGSSTQPTPSA